MKTLIIFLLLPALSFSQDSTIVTGLKLPLKTVELIIPMLTQNSFNTEALDLYVKMLPEVRASKNDSSLVTVDTISVSMTRNVYSYLFSLRQEEQFKKRINQYRVSNKYLDRALLSVELDPENQALEIRRRARQMINPKRSKL